MTRYPNSIPPAPRSMQAAFGPYTDTALHPMPDPPSAHPAEKLILGAAILAALLSLAAKFGGWM